MKTKHKPTTAPDPERAELRGVLEKLFGDPKPAGRIRGGVLKLRYLICGQTGTFSRRTELMSAAITVQTFDGQFQERYGVRLRVSHDVLLRLIDLSDPGGAGPGLKEVISREVEAPAEKLISSGKARRDDTVGVRRHPLGQRLQTGVVGKK